MDISNAKFITSAGDSRGFYKSERPQIAVAGKSNVGKSSFINMLAGARKLARTSALPGRTRLINYFDMGGFILVDLPGYGFAKASKEEIERWGILVDSYIKSEEMLKRVIMLVDIRHSPTEKDKQLVMYLYQNALPFTIIATKADKISRGQIKNRISAIAAELKVGPGDITAVSAQSGYGRDNALNLINGILNAEV